ncbi:MAG: tRNA adenosine(34) deaminase TadA [Candidatus Izimaplasma sp.]|nr:tRNA adenosine(34) deaminase TadA [Candidatus Izimaplasma bacterium]
MTADEMYMALALEEAQKAADIGEVPIGAVIVCEGEVIARAHNLKEATNRAIGHAEILAIDKANETLQSWRLDRCDLYVTIEPCPMCAGAIIQSRIKRLIYGAKDYKAGAHQSVVNIFDQAFNHRVDVTSGILEDSCTLILKKFFHELRKK